MGTKDVLAQQLVSAVKLIERQHMLIINQRSHITGHLSDLNSTKTDIKLQGEIIKATKMERIDIYDEVVKRLSTAVKSSVETGIGKTYSEVVKSSLSGNSTIPKETIKSFAKEIDLEKELSRNIMIFGLSEVKNEKLDERVTEIFENLGEKPRVKSIRLGKHAHMSQARPVKVSLPLSCDIVERLLARSQNLRRGEKFREVYLSADRTPEQRIKHKELVSKLKEKRLQEPQKRHYIKSGII